MITPKLPFLNDPEGTEIPLGLPWIMDAHVHIFLDKIFSAVRNWFDAHAWKIRYQESSPDLISFLLNRGVSRFVALQYAHKPGIARSLNQYMSEICHRFSGRVLGMATVFPGEEGAVEILEQAFELGLYGVKLHAHVQCSYHKFPYHFTPPHHERYIMFAKTTDELRKMMIKHPGTSPSTFLMDDSFAAWCYDNG